MGPWCASHERAGKRYLQSFQHVTISPFLGQGNQRCTAPFMRHVCGHFYRPHIFREKKTESCCFAATSAVYSRDSLENTLPVSDKKWDVLMREPPSGKKGSTLILSQVRLRRTSRYRPKCLDSASEQCHESLSIRWCNKCRDVFFCHICRRWRNDANTTEGFIYEVLWIRNEFRGFMANRKDSMRNVTSCPIETSSRH